MEAAGWVLAYLCGGGAFLGLFDKDRDLDDPWVFLAICVLWLPMAFYVAGTMIGDLLRLERG